MRNFMVMAMLILGSFSANAFADESPATVAPAENAPQCMQIELDGKQTTACVNLSDDQVQNLNVDADASALWRRCEIRCLVVDQFGRCRRWRRICW